MREVIKLLESILITLTDKSDAQTNEVTLTVTKGKEPIFIDFIGTESVNLPSSANTIPGGRPVSELVIVNEGICWLRYKVNVKHHNQRHGSSLLKSPEDRIVRPHSPRKIKNVMLYAIENPADIPATTTEVRLNILT